MSTKALILLHPGFEEMEAVAPVDLLVRAGIKVTQAALGKEPAVTGKNGMTFLADCPLDGLPDGALFDAVILPGGPGIQKIRQDPSVCELLRRHHNAGKWVACICAAPLILLDAGLIKDDTQYTAFPATREELPRPAEGSVVHHGRIITSRGAGTATDFALAIVAALCGAPKADEIAQSICWPQR